MLTHRIVGNLTSERLLSFNLPYFDLFCISNPPPPAPWYPMLSDCMFMFKSTSVSLYCICYLLIKLFPSKSLNQTSAQQDMFDLQSLSEMKILQIASCVKSWSCWMHVFSPGSNSFTASGCKWCRKRSSKDSKTLGGTKKFSPELRTPTAKWWCRAKQSEETNKKTETFKVWNATKHQNFCPPLPLQTRIAKELHLTHYIIYTAGISCNINTALRLRMCTTIQGHHTTKEKFLLF